MAAIKNNNIYIVKVQYDGEWTEYFELNLARKTAYLISCSYEHGQKEYNYWRIFWERFPRERDPLPKELTFDILTKGELFLELL